MWRKKFSAARSCEYYFAFAGVSVCVPTCALDEADDDDDDDYNLFISVFYFVFVINSLRRPMFFVVV